MIALFNAVLDWATRPAVLTPLLVGSGFSLVASVIALPWYLRRLPADYFERRISLAPTERTLSQVALLAVKNLVGGLLVLAGVAMLVLPGQGVATIVMGLLMMQFPGKRRLERRLISIPPVLRAVNALREKSGEPPLVMPPPSLRLPKVPPPGAEPQPHSVR